MPTSCDGGNPVSAPGVGGGMPLVTVDLGRQPKPVKCSPHLEVSVQPSDIRRLFINKILEKKPIIIHIYCMFSTVNNIFLTRNLKECKMQFPPLP